MMFVFSAGHHHRLPAVRHDPRHLGALRTSARRIKWLEPYLIFPRFHHWHHTSQKEAIDKNFAIHFPWIDKLFGTYYFPTDRWPDTYGLHNETIPAGFWGQTFYPFTPKEGLAR